MEKNATEVILEKVKDFVTKAHNGQRRKYTDEPYVTHLIKVMNICRQYTHDVSMLAAALLHDVLEDTSVTKEQLKDFLLTIMENAKAERTLHLVDELTDRFVKSNYPQWNRRKRKGKEMERLAATSADSQTIKYADILDNSTDFAGDSADFAIVFLRECKTLLQMMTKGNPQLYQRTVETVEEGLKARSKKE